MEPTEELTVPGLRLRHPPEVEVDTRMLETRRHRVHKVEIKSPWLTSPEEEGVGARYTVSALVVETLDGSPTGDLLEEGHALARTDRHELKPGRFAGREARLRLPADPATTPRAAYVAGARRFFFVEWRGPAEAILDTLELEPEGGAEARDGG